MINKIFNKLKNFGNQIQELETSVTGERKNFMEVFERNLILEKEIAERTEELGQANKSILTLKHIWSTMNSSEPLSEVLKTIVDGMADNMGYLHCFIFQVYGNDKGEYLKIRDAAKNKFAEKVKDTIDAPLESFCIPLDDNSLMGQAIKECDIKTVNSLSSIFKNSVPQLDEKVINKLDKLFSNRSVSVLPIISQDRPFGCMVVVSIRSEMSDTEKNFLSLFAGQIELAVTIADLFETIREQAITDGLTGLYNRRHFDQCLAIEAKRARRMKQPFSLITLDLDHLKVINDTYGHSAGDAAICSIGDLLKKNARSMDLPSRFGGEEFGIVLPGVDVDGGLLAAERLRSAIETTPVEGVGKITASIGVATFLKHSEDLEELLELADQAMYRAKRSGRNQVQLAQAWDENIWKRQALDSLIRILSKQEIPIDQDLAESLNEKLKAKNAEDKDVDDLIFYVVDEFTKVYNHVYQKGYTKEKIDIAVKIAQKLNLNEEDIVKIKMAAMVYDIGNMLLPESILLKPGPLDDSERREVQKHPIVAAKEILDPMSTAKNIITLIEHLNENYDGSGYPGKLRGESIPIGTRVLVVVDSYFALVSERPYRKAYTSEEAIKILEEGSGYKWDGKIVDLFKTVIQQMPNLV